MKRLWFGLCAPLCAIFCCVSVFAGSRADSRDSRSKDVESVSVDLFDAMRSGDIEVRVIAKDAATGNVLIKNTTKKRLSIKLPEAFAAVPVAAQFGALPGLGGGGMNGGGGFNGLNAGGMNGGMNGGMAGGGMNQSLGGGFMNPGGGAAGNGLGLGNGGNRGMNAGGPFNAGIFDVEPDKARKLKITTVCLQHGNPNPKACIEYGLMPLDSYTSNRDTIEAVKLLARGEVDQRSAQAAAWHFENGMSWDELTQKIGAKHLDGSTERFFTGDQIKLGRQIANEAARRAKADKEGESPTKSLAAR